MSFGSFLTRLAISGFRSLNIDSNLIFKLIVCRIRFNYHLCNYCNHDLRTICEFAMRNI